MKTINKSLLLSTSEILTIVFGSVLSVLSCVFASDVSDVESVSTPLSMAVSAVYVLFALTRPLDQQLFLVAIGIPNTKALGFVGISCSIIVCAIAVFKYYLLNKEKHHLPLGVILYLVYCLFSFAVFNDVFTGIIMPIKQAINMIFFITLASSISISKNAFYVGYKASIALLFGIVSAMSYSLLTASSINRLAVIGNDSNILAVEVAFVLSYFCLAYVKSKSVSSTVFITVVILLALITLICGSRMGFILYATIISVTIIFNIGNSGKMGLIAASLLIAGIVFLKSSFGQDIIDAITLRMEVLEANDDVSNGRFELWNQYISALCSSPTSLFFGLGDYTKYGIEYQAHNFIIEDLAGYGVIGVLILYPTYFAIYRRQFLAFKHFFVTKHRYGIFRLLPLVTPLFGSLTLHGLTSVMCTTMIYLGVLALAEPIIRINESTSN